MLVLRALLGGTFRSPHPLSLTAETNAGPGGYGKWSSLSFGNAALGAVLGTVLGCRVQCSKQAMNIYKGRGTMPVSAFLWCQVWWRTERKNQADL